MAVNQTALVVRTSAFFGPWDEHNFLAKMMSTLNSGLKFLAVSDQIVSPTYVPDLVNNCLDLVIDEASGIWHLTNSSDLSWADFAFQAANVGMLDVRLIKKPVSSSTLRSKAIRLMFSALGTERGVLLPSLEEAIGRYFSAT